MSASTYNGDYSHHSLIVEEEWGNLRKMLNSEGCSERFASTNVRPTGGLMVRGLNAFHVLCYYAAVEETPVDVMAKMLEVDETNLFEKVREPSDGATPLHLACESLHSAKFIKTLLSLKPDVATQLISEKDARGMTPLDVAWLRHIDVAYHDYGGAVSSLDQDDGRVIANLADFSHPNDVGEEYFFAKDTWEKTVHMLFATATEVTDAPTAWSVVQAIASTQVRCPNIAMWVALKVHPEQARWQDRNGNFALHMAASCHNHYRYPIYSSGVDRADRVSIIDAWDNEEEEGKTRVIIDEAQASPISMLVKIYPQAASIPNDDGRYPVHLATKRGAKWDDEVEHLFSAAPGTINKRDPKTMLYPFMLAAVDLEESASADLVYKLLRTNPANVKGGIRNTLYEQYLEEKMAEKDKAIAEKCDAIAKMENNIAENDSAIAEKDSIISDLRSKLKRKAHEMDTEP